MKLFFLLLEAKTPLTMIIGGVGGLIAIINIVLIIVLVKPHSSPRYVSFIMKYKNITPLIVLVD